MNTIESCKPRILGTVRRWGHAWLLLHFKCRVAAGPVRRQRLIGLEQLESREPASAIYGPYLWVNGDEAGDGWDVRALEAADCDGNGLDNVPIAIVNYNMDSRLIGPFSECVGGNVSLSDVSS